MLLLLTLHIRRASKDIVLRRSAARSVSGIGAKHRSPSLYWYCAVLYLGKSCPFNCPLPPVLPARFWLAAAALLHPVGPGALESSAETGMLARPTRTHTTRHTQKQPLAHQSLGTLWCTPTSVGVCTCAEQTPNSFHMSMGRARAV